MEILFRLLLGLIVVSSWLLRPFFWWKTKSKPVTLPPITDPVLKLSATALAKKIRKKEISSENLIRMYIKRIKEVNPVINAVVEDRFLSALEDAKNVDKYVTKHFSNQEELERKTPLLGIPLTVKESCGLSGLSQCGGSLTRLGVKATSDGDAIALLKAAGAIPLLVSNTPELCLSWDSDNLVTGATNNPYNSHYTSGGSSGGEGALLGCGASVIGVGSDIAGSIRVPALFNGIFGHKPTTGIVPLRGHFPLLADEKCSRYLTVGPMTRYAEDLTLMMKVMSGKNGEHLLLDNKLDLSNLKVCFMEEATSSIVLPAVSQEIKMAINKCVKHLGQICQANISPVKFDFMKNSCEIGISLFFSMTDIPNLLQDHKNPKENLSPFVELLKSCFGYSTLSQNILVFYILLTTNGFIPNSSYTAFVAELECLKKSLLNELGTSGVLLYPTFPTSAFRHGELLFKLPGTMYTMIFNLLGFPATHVPVGFDKNNMPIGIQVISTPYQDRLCIQVAEELEKAFGGWNNNWHP